MRLWRPQRFYIIIVISNPINKARIWGSKELSNIFLHEKACNADSTKVKVFLLYFDTELLLILSHLFYRSARSLLLYHVESAAIPPGRLLRPLRWL